MFLYELSVANISVLQGYDYAIPYSQTYCMISLKAIPEPTVDKPFMILGRLAMLFQACSCIHNLISLIYSILFSAFVNEQYW